MSPLGFLPEAPDTRILPPSFVSGAVAALLLAVACAGAGPLPALAQSQDTIRVAGTLLAPDDSVEARRLLQNDLGPTSRHWTRLQDSTERFAAAKTLFAVARRAHPTTWTDSVLSFLRKAGSEHPDPEVRAEFLYGGLQVAESAERDQVQRQFYKRLTNGHEGSNYAEEARRLFAPNSQIQPGNELPEFRLPRLSDSTATFAKGDFEGRTLLIDFWGSWCPPCLRAMPPLHEAYRKYGGDDFTILSVAMRDTREAVRAFRSNRWKMPWHHAFVPKGSDLEKRLRGRFEISSFPMAILVGPDGQILRVHRGVGSGEEMAQAIRDVLAQDGGGEASRSESSGQGRFRP